MEFYEVASPTQEELAELCRLRREFGDHDIRRTNVPYVGLRYTAKATRPGVRPTLVSAEDLLELRAALEAGQAA